MIGEKKKSSKELKERTDWFGEIASAVRQEVTGAVIQTVATPLAALETAVNTVTKVAEYAEGTTEFSKRYRSLEIEINNQTDGDLHYKSRDFKEGEWFTSPDLQHIRPSQTGCGQAANRQGKWEGVKGGIEFEIGRTGLNFYTGFENPWKGDYKSFIAVDKNKSAEWACENNSNGIDKTKSEKGYHLSCCPANAKESKFKKFAFTIRKDILQLKITNKTPDDLKYKNKYMKYKTTLEKECTIAANETETIILTDPSGRLDEVAGGLEYTFLGQKVSLYIGFSKTTAKGLKTFIDIKNDKSAEWACKEAIKDGEDKTYRGYSLRAEIEDKTFCYTIEKDILQLKITNKTPDDLKYKNKYMKYKTTLEKECTIAANETETIILTDPSGRLDEVAGGLEYTFLGQKVSLYIGFSKTTAKGLKTFIDIKNDKSAEWACKEAIKDGEDKTYRGYILRAEIEDKTFCYTIEKDIPENEQRLDFQIINETPQLLLYKDGCFPSEGWHTSDSVSKGSEIKPSEPKDVITAELRGLLSEFKAGLEFEIKNSKLSLYIGFYRSEDGEEKYFMQVAQGKTAKWAAETCLQNSDVTQSGNFQVLHQSKSDERRTVFTYNIKYNIPENEKRLAFQIINETPEIFLFKENFFPSQGWVISQSEPPESEIKPYEPKDVITTDLRGLRSEIKVGLEFKIKNTELSLYIGFYRSENGKEKYFMQIAQGKTAKWAAEKCLQDSDATQSEKNFQFQHQSKSEERHTVFTYTIKYDIPENEKRLAFQIINKTPKLLKFKKPPYFSSKTWKLSLPEPSNTEIKPCKPKEVKATDAIAAELSDLTSELKVGLEFEIGNTELSLYIGFYKPSIGEEKHFMMVTNNKTAEWAAEQCLANSEKLMTNKTYKLNQQCKKESQRTTYEYTMIYEGVSCGCFA